MNFTRKTILLRIAILSSCGLFPSLTYANPTFRLPDTPSPTLEIAAALGNNQVAAPEQVTIAFGEKLSLNSPLPAAVQWTIFQPSGAVLHGEGDSLRNFVFAQPGSYSIQLTDNQVHGVLDCGHPEFPGEIQLTVTNTRMTFDFGNMTFSNPLENGAISGTILSLPVTVASFNGQPVLFQQQDVKTAGVGTTISATPETPNLTLIPGNHLLRYTLTGSVDRATFIMFDFVDVNGKVCSFAYPHELN